MNDVLLHHQILFLFMQEISTLDVKEVAFNVLEQLPDVTILSRGDFQVGHNEHHVCMAVMIIHVHKRHQVICADKSTFIKSC